MKYATILVIILTIISCDNIENSRNENSAPDSSDERAEVERLMAVRNSWMTRTCPSAGFLTEMDSKANDILTYMDRALPVINATPEGCAIYLYAEETRTLVVGLRAFQRIQSSDGMTIEDARTYIASASAQVARCDRIFSLSPHIDYAHRSIVRGFATCGIVD